MVSQSIAVLSLPFNMWTPDMTLDAGYGSEENYVYLEDQDIDAYVKYGTFDREQKKRRKLPEREKYWSSNWPYDDQRDEFTCPQGKRLTYEFSRTVRSDNGYRAERRVYQCKECEPCPVRTQCTRSKYGRRVYFSLPLRKYRQTASERLRSPE